MHTLFVRDFAAMGSSSFNPQVQFPVHSAEWTVWLLRFEITLTLSRASTTLTPVDHRCSQADSNHLTSRLAELVCGANHYATSPPIGYQAVAKIQTFANIQTVASNLAYIQTESNLEVLFRVLSVVHSSVRVVEHVLEVLRLTDIYTVHLLCYLPLTARIKN